MQTVSDFGNLSREIEIKMSNAINYKFCIKEILKDGSLSEEELDYILDFLDSDELIDLFNEIIG